MSQSKTFINSQNRIEAGLIHPIINKDDDLFKMVQTIGYSSAHINLNNLKKKGIKNIDRKSSNKNNNRVQSARVQIYRKRHSILHSPQFSKNGIQNTLQPTNRSLVHNKKQYPIKPQKIQQYCQNIAKKEVSQLNNVWVIKKSKQLNNKQQRKNYSLKRKANVIIQPQVFWDKSQRLQKQWEEMKFIPHAQFPITNLRSHKRLQKVKQLQKTNMVDSQSSHHQISIIRQANLKLKKKSNHSFQRPVTVNNIMSKTSSMNSFFNSFKQTIIKDDQDNVAIKGRKIYLHN